MEELKELYFSILKKLQKHIERGTFNNSTAYDFMCCLIGLCSFTIGAQRRQILTSFSLKVIVVKYKQFNFISECCLA